MVGEQVKINNKASNPVFTDEEFSSTPNFASYISFNTKDLLYWWYIQMPIYYLNKINRISTVVSDQLSIIVLLRNFFIPWKRHRAAVGYFIGILTKLMYLPFAIFIYLLVMATYLSFILIWLSIPPVTILFLLISLFI